MTLEGLVLSSRTAGERLMRGIALCPADRHLFPRMTVLENLVSGGALLGIRTARKRAGEWLDRFPFLAERGRQLAGTLSGGEQRLLAVCRSLISTPKLLLLDDPSAGLSPLWKAEVSELVGSCSAAGMAVVLADDDDGFALPLASTVVGLRAGKIVFRGSRPTEVELRRLVLDAEVSDET